MTGSILRIGFEGDVSGWMTAEGEYSIDQGIYWVWTMAGIHKLVEVLEDAYPLLPKARREVLLLFLVVVRDALIRAWLS